jgi:hypothetical protein
MESQRDATLIDDRVEQGIGDHKTDQFPLTVQNINHNPFGLDRIGRSRRRSRIGTTEGRAGIRRDEI